MTTTTHAERVAEIFEAVDLLIDAYKGIDKTVPLPLAGPLTEKASRAIKLAEIQPRITEIATLANKLHAVYERMSLHQGKDPRFLRVDRTVTHDFWQPFDELVKVREELKHIG